MPSWDIFVESGVVAAPVGELPETGSLRVSTALPRPKVQDLDPAVIGNLDVARLPAKETLTMRP